METWSASLQDMSSYSQHSDLIFRCSLSLPCQLAAKWTTCSAWQVAPHHTAPPPRPASTDARDGPRATAPFLVCAVPTPRPVWMRLTIIAATATSAGGSEWIAAPAFFFFSSLYTVCNDNKYSYIYDIISCARCRCYSVTERCMQMQWTMLAIGNAIPDIHNFQELSRCFVCTFYPPLSIYLLCLKKKKATLCLRRVKKIKLYQIYKNNINIYISRYITL
jgi:hypothetical protein